MVGTANVPVDDGLPLRNTDDNRQFDFTGNAIIKPKRTMADNFEGEYYFVSDARLYVATNVAYSRWNNFTRLGRISFSIVRPVILLIKLYSRSVLSTKRQKRERNLQQKRSGPRVLTTISVVTSEGIGSRRILSVVTRRMFRSNRTVVVTRLLRARATSTKRSRWTVRDGPPPSTSKRRLEPAARR